MSLTDGGENGGENGDGAEVSPRQRRESDWTQRMRAEIENKESTRAKVHKSEHLFQHELYDQEYCWVMIFPNERHKSYEFTEERQEELKKAREDCLFKMKTAGLCLKPYMSADGDELVIEIGMPQRYLEFIATQLQLPITAELTVKEMDETTGKQGCKTYEAFRTFDMMKLTLTLTLTLIGGLPSL